MKRLVVSLLAAVLSGMAVAEVPPAPEALMRGIINGKINVWYRKTLPSGTNVEVQMRDHGASDEAWRTVPLVWTSDFDHNNYNARGLLLATNFVGTADLRLRAVNTDGASDWVTLDSLSAYDRITGTRIGPSETVVTSLAPNADDGNMGTMIDNANAPWMGYKFDKPKRIRGIRFFSRPDDNCYNRIYGATIECASDENFTDGEIVFTSSSANTSRTTVNDIVFDTPKLVGAVRFNTVVMNSVCEWEILPADNPYRPAATVAASDITNFYAHVAWTIPAGAHAVRARVWRSNVADGTYEPLTDEWTEGASGSFTDQDLLVSQQFYYKVVAETDHPTFGEGTIESAPVAFRRARRLERAWSDETKLLDGITIMQPTNGNWSAVSGKWTLAWDGNAKTFPDTGSAEYSKGPIGLDFGERVWVTGFGYVCRNDNDGYLRISTTALYAASGDDAELNDKVQVSDTCQVVSKDTTLHVQSCTTVLPDGANCYFLYFTKSWSDYWRQSFCCNVSELMFFGWTQADVDAAGVVTAPTAVTVTRRMDGTGADLAWGAGAYAVSYAVQRRVRSASEWTDLGSVSADATLAFADTTAKAGAWEYRVVSVGSEGKTPAPSETVSCVVYAVGNGTGLSGTLLWPYVADDATKCEPTQSAALGTGAVNLSLAAGAEFVSGTGCTCEALLLWSGKLIVPIAGNYSISLETTDGGAVMIDDAYVCNSWTGGTKTPSGVVTLTAGEHDIDVKARLQDAANGKRCILRWGGTVSEEVIPASQLRPSAQSPSLALGDWKVAYFNGRMVGRAKAITGGYQLRGTADDDASGRNALNSTYLYRETSSDFTVECLTTGVQNGRVGILARSAGGNLIWLRRLRVTSNLTDYDARLVRPGETALSQLGSTVQSDGGVSKYYNLGWLKMTRRNGTYNLYWRDNQTTDRDWNLLTSWTDDGSLGRDVQVGFTVSGGSGSASVQSEFKLTNVKFREHKGTVLVVR